MAKGFRSEQHLTPRRTVLRSTQVVIVAASYSQRDNQNVLQRNPSFLIRCRIVGVRPTPDILRCSQVRIE